MILVRFQTKTDANGSTSKEYRNEGAPNGTAFDRYPGPDQGLVSDRPGDPQVTTAESANINGTIAAYLRSGIIKILQKLNAKP